MRLAPSSKHLILNDRCRVIEKLKKLTEEFRKPATMKGKKKNVIDFASKEDKYLAILKAKKTLHYDQARLITIPRPGDQTNKKRSKSKKKQSKPSEAKEAEEDNGDGEFTIGKNEALIKRKCFERFGPVSSTVSEAYVDIAEKLLNKGKEVKMSMDIIPKNQARAFGYVMADFTDRFQIINWWSD